MTLDISAFPRVSLGHLPTPLEPLDRLSSLLGGPRVWIKRDDCTGLATGGNKTRKLEFLLADALASGADTVITFGAVQSNHARQTAAACARLGLECHLVLSKVVPWSDREYETTGNVLLDRILGAKVHLVAASEAAIATTNLRNALSLAGRRVYVIPTGGSNATGALGYVSCAIELMSQCEQNGFVPDYIIHATSSGGTQAGLAVGLHETAVRLIGINVSEPSHSTMTARVSALVQETLAKLGHPGGSIPITIRHEFLGTGYGVPSPEALSAIRCLAASDGILTDPVYSGKSLAALIHLVRNGELKGGKNVLFIHTGGVGAIPAYKGAFGD